MKNWIFILVILGTRFISGSGQGLPLTRMILYSEQILSVHYIGHTGDSLYFESKDLHTKGAYTDTIVMLQSQAFRAMAGRVSEDEINRQVRSGLERAESMIVFVHHFAGKVVTPVNTGIRIYLDGEVLFHPNYIVAQDSYFVSFLEKISWDEMVDRIHNIEMRFASVYALHEIKDLRKRNDALFGWLEAHIAEFQVKCDFNADCGWGGMQDMVLRWITDANDMADTWKVGGIFQHIYPGGLHSFDSFNGVYPWAGDSFKSGEGLTFLLDKALDKTQPILERKQALEFMITATDFVMHDQFQFNAYFYNRSQEELRQYLLDQIMPLMHEEEMAYLAFINILRLSHSEDPSDIPKLNLSKLPELMEIYKDQSAAYTQFRERFTRFLLDNCTEAQWKSLTGNDAMIYMGLPEVRFIPEKKQLYFQTYYIGREGLITEMPKVYFEKWVNGKLKEKSEKEFRNENGSPWTSAPTYLQQVVDVGDLSPGKWKFYLSGVAGEKGQWVWKSEEGRFEK